MRHRRERGDAHARTESLDPLACELDPAVVLDEGDIGRFGRRLGICARPSHADVVERHPERPGLIADRADVAPQLESEGPGGLELDWPAYVRKRDAHRIRGVLRP